MNNVTILVNIFDNDGSYCLSVWIWSQQLFYTNIIFKSINIILFENWQEFNPMGLSAYLDDYKKQYFTNVKMSPTFLILSKIIFQGIEPMGLCFPWADYFINNTFFIKT